jgi:hypothetical protein
MADPWSIKAFTEIRNRVWATRDSCFSHYPARCPAWCPNVEPNKHGNPRITIEFVIWMMGWQQDWFAGTELARVSQFMLLGNGVVPQQAQLAIDALGIVV